MNKIPSHIFPIGNLYLSCIRASTCTLYISYGKDNKRCYVDLELDFEFYEQEGMPMHHLRRFFYSEKYETV